MDNSASSDSGGPRLVVVVRLKQYPSYWIPLGQEQHLCHPSMPPRTCGHRVGEFCCLRRLRPPPHLLLPLLPLW